MSVKMNRAQRRSLEKEKAKQSKKVKKNKDVQNKDTPPAIDHIKTPEEALAEVSSKLNAVVSDLKKVYNYLRTVDTKHRLLEETLCRKEVTSLEDINETEYLYQNREVVKDKRIKELLEQDFTAREYMEQVKENSDLLGFEKLNINPVKDLNQNPYEIALLLKEDHPNLKGPQYMEIGKKWKLTEHHFGLKKEKI